MIQAFGLQMYRRVLRVYWVEHRTNESNFEQIIVYSGLLQKVNKSYQIGHWSYIQANIIYGKKCNGRNNRKDTSQRKINYGTNRSDEFSHS